MSFGDIAQNRGTLALPALAAPITELQGTLNALSANNAALRRTSEQLRCSEASDRPSLRRVRELREQNRDIARAAATLASRVDASDRRDFEQLIAEFSGALRESVEAEQEMLQREKDKAGGGAMGAELEQELMGERTALLQRYDPEAGMMREIEGNEKLMRERNDILAEMKSSIDDVNAIFRDLAGMIGEQSIQVDYVQVAVEDASENVRRGQAELRRVQRRREGRKGIFFCALVGIALVVALFVIIVLS